MNNYLRCEIFFIELSLEPLTKTIMKCYELTILSASVKYLLRIFYYIQIQPK